MPDEATGRRRPGSSRLLAVVLAGSFLVAGLALAASRASAAFVDVPETGRTGYLALSTDPNPLMFSGMSPGTVGYGQIAMSLSDAATAETRLEMYANGALLEHPNGIRISAAICDAEWQRLPSSPVSPVGPSTPTCPANERPIVSVGPGSIVSGSPGWDLGRLDAQHDRFVLVTVLMPDASASYDESLMGLSADFAFHITAQGDDTVPDPGTPPPGGTGPAPAGGLAATGLDALALLLTAAGALILGLLALLGRRRRTVSTREPHGAAHS